MQDTVIKNTGNSRYLKSGIETDTTWTEFLQMLIAGTLPIDLNGLNSAGIQQQGTLLNTANLLSSSVCTALGLTQASAVPSDALLALTQMLPRTNLLDNWYFPNAVNQRGETSWAESVRYIATVDRWVKDGNKNTIDYTAGYSISLEHGSTSGISPLSQYLDKATYDEIRGRKFVVSVVCENVSGSTVRLSYHNIGSPVSPDLMLHDGINSFVFNGPTAEYPTSRPALRIATSNAGDYADIIAIKMEIGETQTLARTVNGSVVLNDVPNYGEQLLRCKRFYQIIEGGAFPGMVRAYASGEYRLYISLPLAVDMDESISEVEVSSPSETATWWLTDKSSATIASVNKDTTGVLGSPNNPKNGSYSVGCTGISSNHDGKLGIAYDLTVVLSTENC